MGNTIGIAITGLNSAAMRLSASASNIANMQNTGSLTDESIPTYEALTTQSTTTSSGGCFTKIVIKEPATTIAFDPDAFYADEAIMCDAVRRHGSFNRAMILTFCGATKQRQRSVRSRPHPALFQRCARRRASSLPIRLMPAQEAVPRMVPATARLLAPSPPRAHPASASVARP